MPTSTPIYGLPVPTAAESDDVPAILAAALNAAELFFVGRFPDGATRDAQIPLGSRIRGMLIYNSLLSRYESWDGAAWGAVNTSKYYTNTGGSASGLSGATLITSVSVPALGYAYRIRATSVLRMNTTAASADMRSQLRWAVSGGLAAGTDFDYCDFTMGATSFATFKNSGVVEVPDGTARDIGLYLVRTNGTGTVTVAADSKINRVDLAVEMM